MPSGDFGKGLGIAWFKLFQARLFRACGPPNAPAGTSDSMASLVLKLRDTVEPFARKRNDTSSVVIHAKQLDQRFIVRRSIRYEFGVSLGEGGQDRRPLEENEGFIAQRAALRRRRFHFSPAMSAVLRTQRSRIDLRLRGDVEAVSLSGAELVANCSIAKSRVALLRGGGAGFLRCAGAAVLVLPGLRPRRGFSAVFNRIVRASSCSIRLGSTRPFGAMGAAISQGTGATESFRPNTASAASNAAL
jgi:hypothetical protein